MRSVAECAKDSDTDMKIECDHPDFKAVTTADLELIYDALGLLYMIGPSRRDELADLCLRTGFLLSA